MGFKHWHPVAVTADGDKLAGQGEMGGVWEWTSSVLERHEGFREMELYPAYTGEFNSSMVWWGVRREANLCSGLLRWEA